MITDRKMIRFERNTALFRGKALRWQERSQSVLLILLAAMISPNLLEAEFRRVAVLYMVAAMRQAPRFLLEASEFEGVRMKAIEAVAESVEEERSCSKTIAWARARE